MASLRFCACLILIILHAVPRSESRVLNPYVEGKTTTSSFGALSITTSSGKVHQFSVPLIDEYTKNLYASKRLSPGGPDPKHH
ncbi:Uncharacterized protein TCM_029748 [Theobroma cacao]|uniref:Uncharacterized protein n=1 Tax=Theobroma cacao TaxID=3641 RepID=A0A061GDV1_THECC|nr:Uncharacterized protein TCM_029748 [Theobroma cacao]